jgi:hypothetical protein
MMDRDRAIRVARLTLLVTTLGVAAACGSPIWPPSDGNGVECGRFAGPDCNDLLEIGNDAVADDRTEAPVAIAVDSACPPNARCAASALGGDTAAVIVRWSDGTLAWATIPLPQDWPVHAPGEPTVESGQPPEHLRALVGE